jgi:hypothetical protein
MFVEFGEEDDEDMPSRGGGFSRPSHERVVSAISSRRFAELESGESTIKIYPEATGEVEIHFDTVFGISLSEFTKENVPQIAKSLVELQQLVDQLYKVFSDAQLVVPKRVFGTTHNQYLKTHFARDKDLTVGAYNPDKDTVTIGQAGQVMHYEINFPVGCSEKKRRDIILGVVKRLSDDLKKSVDRAHNLEQRLKKR